MNKILPIILGIIFSFKAYGDDTLNQENIKFIDLVYICINGIDNVDNIGRDFKYLGAKKLIKKSYLKDGFDTMGYIGMAYENDKQKNILYYGKTKDSGKIVHVCGIIVDNENYDDVSNKIENGYDIKFLGKTKMGPKIEQLYDIDIISNMNVLLQVTQSSNKKNGVLRYDVVGTME
jgi:hypothetical protein